MVLKLVADGKYGVGLEFLRMPYPDQQGVCLVGRQRYMKIKTVVFLGNKLLFPESPGLAVDDFTILLENMEIDIGEVVEVDADVIAMQAAVRLEGNP